MLFSKPSDFLFATNNENLKRATRLILRKGALGRLDPEDITDFTKLVRHGIIFGSSASGARRVAIRLLGDRIEVSEHALTGMYIRYTFSLTLSAQDIGRDMAVIDGMIGHLEHTVATIIINSKLSHFANALAWPVLSSTAP